MTLTIASGLIFLICATVFGIAYYQAKKDAEQKNRKH